MANTCTCEVPQVSFGKRELAGERTETNGEQSAGLIVACAVHCKTCAVAAQSIYGFEHAFMILRNGLCKPPVIEAPDA